MLILCMVYLRSLPGGKYAGVIPSSEYLLSANNKEAKITIKMPGRSIHGEKVADTFEEAINHCIDIARRALEKTK